MAGEREQACAVETELMAEGGGRDFNGGHRATWRDHQGCIRVVTVDVVKRRGGENGQLAKERREK